MKGGTVQKIKALLFALGFSVFLAVPSFATLESDVSAIKTSVGTSLGSNISSIYSSIGSSLGSNVSSIKTDTSSIKSYCSSISSAVSNYLSLIPSKLDNIYSNVVSIASDVGTIKTRSQSIDDGISVSNLRLSSLVSGVNSLVSFFVNPQHQALEDASEASVQSATDIVNGSDQGASTASKVSSAGSFGSDVSGLISNPANPSQVIDILTSGQTGTGVSVFDWFSQTTLDNLNGGPASRSAPVIVTHYYQDNNDLFHVFLGGDDR